MSASVEWGRKIKGGAYSREQEEAKKKWKEVDLGVEEVERAGQGGIRVGSKRKGRMSQKKTSVRKGVCKLGVRGNKLQDGDKN